MSIYDAAMRYQKEHARWLLSRAKNMAPVLHATGQRKDRNY